MSNPIANRIMSQMVSNVPTPAEVAFEAIQQASVISPISIDELRKILQSELACIVQPVLSSVQEVHFDNIYDFIPWYKQNKESFSPQQRTALDSLEVARATIDAGCACKRSVREIKAHQYFEQFWLNNKGTDLLPTICQITNAPKVSINAYCAYTR